MCDFMRYVIMLERSRVIRYSSLLRFKKVGMSHTRDQHDYVMREVELVQDKHLWLKSNTIFFF